MSAASAPRQEEEVLRSTRLHERRARTRRPPTYPFSKICTQTPSGHTALSHPGQVAEEKYCPPRMSSSVSSNDCMIVGAQALSAQEDSHGHVEDMDGLASSDGDDLSSLDSADIGELGAAILEGCRVGPRTSPSGVGGLAGGSYASGHDESEICHHDPSDLETDQSKPDAAGTDCKMSPRSAPVEERSSLEGVWSKGQLPQEDHGRRRCSGVVPEEAIPPMLEGSLPLGSKSCWEIPEASISERDAAAGIDLLGVERVVTSTRLNSLSESAKRATAPVDEWSCHDKQASKGSTLPDVNGCITYSDDLTAFVQPYLQNWPKPLARQHDILSNGFTRSGSMRGLLPRPLSMAVYSGASNASRMPSPPPPGLWRGSTGPPHSLEAYTRFQDRSVESTRQWQPQQKHALISAISAEALKSPPPSNAGRDAGRDLPIDSSPKASFPTMPKPDSPAVASFSPSFTTGSVSAPADMGTRASTCCARCTLLSLLFHILPYPSPPGVMPSITTDAFRTSSSQH